MNFSRCVQQQRGTPLNAERTRAPSMVHGPIALQLALSLLAGSLPAAASTQPGDGDDTKKFATCHRSRPSLTSFTLLNLQQSAAAAAADDDDDDDDDEDEEETTSVTTGSRLCRTR